jgi:hypothetical protein
MNEFILSAKEDALGTLKKLFTLTLLKNSVIGFISQLLIFALMIPILIFALNTDFSSLLSLQERMQNSPFTANQDLTIYLQELFPNANFIGLIPVFFVYLLLFSWLYAFILSNNDFYIKHLTQNIGNALKRSLSKITINVFVSTLLSTLYLILLFSLFIAIVSMISTFSQAAAGIVGFVAFIFVILISIKTIYIIPAVVHGNMNFFTAFGDSWKKITLKRAAKFFVVGLTLVILFFLTALISSFFAYIFKQILGADSVAMMVFSQIISLVLNIVLSNLIFAGMSTLYFRYKDLNQEMDQSEH